MKKSSLGLLVTALFVVVFLTSMAAHTSNEEGNLPAAGVGRTVPTDRPAEAAVQQEEWKITSSMEDALFIGDSRTVGLREYAGLNEADFFAAEGMSVYSVRQEKAAVAGMGKLSLEELLERKSYGKIFLMLGINELGYRRTQNVEWYQTLVEQLKQSQPQAVIILQANLHVSRARSSTDAVFNNPALDRFHAEISALADGKRVFYLDVNPLFDDKEGNLDAQLTGDDIHLYPKHYKAWEAWLREQTAALAEESKNE